jgi:hypothetical protein
MLDYALGLIYKVVDMRLVQGDVGYCVYVGSTTQKLTKRMYEHRHKSKSKWAPFHKYINEQGIDNFKIVLVEPYPCRGKAELNMREEHWRCKLGPTHNVYRAYATKAQRAEDDRKSQRIYYHNNVDKINKKVRCECGTTISKQNIAKHRKSKKHERLMGAGSTDEASGSCNESMSDTREKA